MTQTVGTIGNDQFYHTVVDSLHHQKEGNNLGSIATWRQDRRICLSRETDKGIAQILLRPSEARSIARGLTRAATGLKD